MGYIRHHTIVVTSWDEKLIKEIHETAQDIFEWVSPISPQAQNGYRSFFVPPDGSKEGWPESEVGDANRACFVQYLKDMAYADGSTAASWVESQYDDDNHEAKVVSASDWIERKNE